LTHMQKNEKWVMYVFGNIAGKLLEAAKKMGAKDVDFTGGEVMLKKRGGREGQNKKGGESITAIKSSQLRLNISEKKEKEL